MPNIREFSNPIDGLQPSDKGIQSSILKARHIESEFAQAGEAIGQGASDLGQAYNRIKTQQDLSSGLAQKAQIWDNLTTAQDVHMNQADPNDHGAAEKFLEEQVKPLTDAWATGFSTRESQAWAQEQAGQLIQHFTERGNAIQSEKAGSAAVQNLHDATVGFSNAAMQDPASMNTILGAADQGLDALIASDPNLRPDQVDKLKGEIRTNMRQEIARGSFIGMARTNPEAAMQAMADGKFAHLVDATTSNSMFGFAESLAREKRSDARAEYAMNKEAQRDDFNAKASALQAQVFQPDGSVKIPPGFNQQVQLLALHPGAEPGRIEALGNAAKAAAEASINGTFQRTDNATWQNLAGRIGQPPGSPSALTHTQVDQAYAAGELSQHDWRFLHQSVETARSDPMTTSAMRDLNQALIRNKPLVTNSNLYSGKLDQTGDVNYDALHYDVFQKFQQLQSSGMSATEAAKVLTDPRDPRGIHAMLPHYQSNNKAGLQAIHERVSAGGGPTNVAAPSLTTARKPGESAADYLKRTGG